MSAARVFRKTLENLLARILKVLKSKSLVVASMTPDEVQRHKKRWSMIHLGQMIFEGYPIPRLPRASKQRFFRSFC